MFACDLLRPLVPHNEDCSRYLQCVETSSGLEQMERECAPLLWFNTETLTCDWPHAVKLVRPECTGESIVQHTGVPDEPGTWETGISSLKVTQNS